MKRFLGIILVIIFFVACGESRPKDIFPEQKMIDILFDLHLADGYISSYPIDSIASQKVNYYLTVYQKYGTDSAGLRRNLNYYASHPQEMEDVYAQISKRLQNEDERLRNVDMAKHREIFKQDSTVRKRATDSLHLLQRDSAIHFIGVRDLFTPADSVSANAVGSAVMQSILNEQKKWEMTFYYFGPSNLQMPTPLLLLKEEPAQPTSLLKNEEGAIREPMRAPIPN